MAFDSKEYYLKNKERINEYNRQYFEIYYQQNKEKLSRNKRKVYIKKCLLGSHKDIEGGCTIKCNVTVTF